MANSTDNLSNDIMDLTAYKKRQQISMLNGNHHFQKLMLQSTKWEQVVAGLNDIGGFDVRVSPDTLSYFEKKFAS